MNEPHGRAEGDLHHPPLGALCLLVFLAVIPVTLLVPILKPLVLDRYSVSPFAAHAFLSANMVGAILAAPLVGWAIDRIGRRLPIVVAAFVLDALLILALGWAPNYATLMIMRFFEGITHIAALTGVMGVALAMAHRNPIRSAPTVSINPVKHRLFSAWRGSRWCFCSAGSCSAVPERLTARKGKCGRAKWAPVCVPRSTVPLDGIDANHASGQVWHHFEFRSPLDDKTQRFDGQFITDQFLDDADNKPCRGSTVLRKG